MVLWTGEKIGNSAGGSLADYLGDGIFKSTDNGVTWTQLNSTSNENVFNPGPFNYVWRLALDKSNSSQDEIYAAVVGGILKSVDGGTTWITVLGDSLTGDNTDVIVTSTGIVYATLSSDANSNPGIWRSTTGDKSSWTNITPGGWPTNYNRTVLSAAPSDENVVYFFSQTPGAGNSGHSLWKYTSGTWENRSSSIPNDFDTQGSYDQFIAVKPNDSEVIFIGGIDLVRSENGFLNNSTNTIIGGTGSGPLGDYPNHFPDQHKVFFDLTNPSIMFSSNDGGVFRTDDNLAGTVTWTELNNNYVTTQFYGFAIDYASTSKIVTGGMQDRGNFFVNPDNSNNWIVMDDFGIDGAYHAISSNRTFYYFSFQNGGLLRAKFTDTGVKSNFAEINPQNATGQTFVNPYTMDPGDTEIIYYVGGEYLWRTNSASTASSNSGWTRMDNSNVNGATISAVGVSKTNSTHIVYYGTDDGQIFRIDNANTGDPTPVDIWTGKGLPNGYVSCIAVDKTNSNKALAVFSNYNILSLFYTSDGGSTWTSVGGNLEENTNGTGDGPSTRWASILNFNGQTIYLVATSTGLASTTNLNGSSIVWANEAATTIGNVVCVMVLSRDSDGYIAVGTHGNGVFTALTTVTGIDVVSNNIPNSFALSQNYPNPFNPSTKIQFSIPEATNVNLTIYDQLGKKVKELLNKNFSAGKYSVDFNANNLSSGVYYYRIIAGNFVQSNKMILIK